MHATDISPKAAHTLPCSGGALEVIGLSHAYGATAAIDEVAFSVPEGEIVALLGPSGCGKSTVLRAIAGLVRPQHGRVLLGGIDFTGVPARLRGIGMVFQSYALFPHMTAAENIAYPMACKGVKRPARRQRVSELLSLVRLEAHASRLPRQLSGGQQQRVALARALAAQPSLLLLDEPFGALDRALRFDLQVELLRLQKSIGITTLIVTHDQEEARVLASQLVLMNKGRVEQIGTPTELYDHPKTLFASSFIGQSSRLAGTTVNETGILLSTGEMLTMPQRLPFVDGSKVILVCRPEHIRIARQPSANMLTARLLVTLPFGPSTLQEFQLADGTELRSAVPRDTAVAASAGDQVSVAIDLAQVLVFPANDHNADGAENHRHNNGRLP